MATLEYRGGAGAGVVGFHAIPHDCDRMLCAPLRLFVLPRYPQNQAHLVRPRVVRSGVLQPPYHSLFLTVVLS